MRLTVFTKTSSVRLGLAFLALSTGASAQIAPQTQPSVAAAYAVEKDLVYVKLGAWEGKLDVYWREGVAGLQPALVYFHSGGALGSGGRKDAVILDLVPFLESGWTVVNVEYTQPGLTLAPVAVQNVVCAVRWVFANGGKYGVDPTRVVTSGWSSGGWAALMAAMVPASPTWDRPCSALAPGKIAAVVSRAGVSDFAAALEGPEAKPWARYWFQALPNAADVAKAVSPSELVRAGLPPVLSIHGDADQVVPYGQSVRLHDALRRAGISEELVTMKGGGHGLQATEKSKAWEAVARFLARHGIAAK